MTEFEQHLEILVRNRFHLVQHLQVERPFLMDYLLSKSVFDRNDYDLVRAEKTREQKACKVLDIIETKGENGFNHFKDALQLINPNLYETLTGEKATYRDSPILDTMAVVGDGNRLIDQDILSSHLKRVTDDLRDMTLRYDTLLKEDQHLRKALEVLKQDKDVMKTRLEFLEKQLEEAEAVASETYSSANMSLRAQYEAIQRDRNDNKDFIIQLQMKLLQSQEEYEKRTRELDEFKSKCETLQQRLSQVNENYIFQRGQTKTLTDKLKSRTEEAEQYENLKQQCREKQYQILELKSLLEDKTKELDELNNWAEALKNRYDTVLEERNEILVKQHTTVESFSHSQNINTDLKIKLNRLTRELTELKKERGKLDKEVAMYRQQAKTENEAYLKATEKIEEVKAYFKKLVDSKDKDLNEKKELVDFYQKEVEELKGELRQSKEELNETLKNNDDLLSQISKLRTEFDMTVETLEEEISRWEERYGNEEQEPTCPRDDEDQESCDDQDNNSYNWKKRMTGDLVKSIRKRFTESPVNPSVEDKREHQFRKSLSFDSWLENMVPAYNDLSLESRKKFSLDRMYGHKLMQPLPYETVNLMFSKGTNAVEFPPKRLGMAGDRTAATSLPFYDRMRMKHLRKSSSPFPMSECDPLALQQLREFLGEKWRGEEMEHKMPCQDEEQSLTRDDVDCPKTVQQQGPDEADDNNNIQSPSIMAKKETGFRPRTRAITHDIYMTGKRHSSDYLVPSANSNSKDYEDEAAVERGS